MDIVLVLWLLVPVLIILAAWRINKTLREMVDATRQNTFELQRIAGNTQRPQDAAKGHHAARLPGE